MDMKIINKVSLGYYADLNLVSTHCDKGLKSYLDGDIVCCVRTGHWFNTLGVQEWGKRMSATCSIASVYIGLYASARRLVGREAVGSRWKKRRVIQRVITKVRALCLIHMFVVDRYIERRLWLLWVIWSTHKWSTCKFWTQFKSNWSCFFDFVELSTVRASLAYRWRKVF